MFTEKANPASRRVEKRNYRMDETQCLRMIRASLAPSTGCTEPAAIALNAATARKAAQGTVTQVTARLDAYLFKNAMGVGIPGADERGVDLCVALGITAGDADAGMNALHTVTAEQLAAAKALRGCVKVEIVDGVSGLYIETILRTDCDAVRVVTVGAHDHIALVEHAPFTEAPAVQESVEEGGAHCGSLAEFIAFADTVALDKLAFLRDALTMNRTIYDRAMSDELAHCVLPKITLDDPSLCASAKRMAGAASYARMHGVPLPVMTATGSGNQGITLFLTVDAAARYFSIPEEKELRAIALAALAVYFFWKKPSSWLERWVFILIFSGGLGNLIDRVLNGYVVDFFATTFMNFAVFNVADCFVCVGAALFVIAVLRQELNAKKEQKAGTDENA